MFRLKVHASIDKKKGSDLNLANAMIMEFATVLVR